MPTGKVLFIKTAANGQRYGFIEPDHGKGDLWFGIGQVWGTVERYDRVQYDEGDYRPGKGPTAKRVRLIEEQEKAT